MIARGPGSLPRCRRCASCMHVRRLLPLHTGQSHVDENRMEWSDTGWMLLYILSSIHLMSMLSLVGVNVAFTGQVHGSIPRCPNHGLVLSVLCTQSPNTKALTSGPHTPLSGLRSGDPPPSSLRSNSCFSTCGIGSWRGTVSYCGGIAAVVG